MSEANESPVVTACREVTEDLGLDIQIGALLCVDWVSPHGPWDDSLMFIFDGGVLSDDQIGGITLLDGELAAFEFCSAAEASKRLRTYLFARLTAALDALTTGRVMYRHDGRSPYPEGLAGGPGG